MSTQPEPTLSRVLHDLADAPGPAGLADRALTGARGMRRRRQFLAGTAGVAVIGVLALPVLLLRPDDRPVPGRAAGPAASTPAASGATLGPCVQAPQRAPTVKEVNQADWPPFVRIAIDKLPPRADYVMQSGYGVCDAESPDAPNAYAVINLGHGREQGHLTVYLAANGMPGGVDTCAALRAYVDATMKASPDSAPGEVLFCSEGTAATPMLSGVRYYGVLTVTARYADRRAVWMESHPAQPGQAPTVDADALRTVVSDRALVDLLLR